ncbi:MAG: hypothetical protein ACYDCK_15540, partial [Thermoplasmatota archaeon]
MSPPATIASVSPSRAIIFPRVAPVIPSMLPATSGSGLVARLVMLFNACGPSSLAAWASATRPQTNATGPVAKVAFVFALANSLRAPTSERTNAMARRMPVPRA